MIHLKVNMVLTILIRWQIILEIDEIIEQTLMVICGDDIPRLVC